MKRAARCLRRWGGGVVLATCWLPALAQPAYKCVQGGSVRYSDRPCETTEAKPLGTVAAPAPAQPDGQAGVASHSRFMSATCRQQSESLRRLQEHLVSGETAEALQRYAAQQEQYDLRCREEEYRARERAASLMRAEAEQRQNELEARRRELEQCAEMRRILDAKRSQLATMSAGERADLQRFDANFTARCQRASQR